MKLEGEIRYIDGSFLREFSRYFQLKIIRGRRLSLRYLNVVGCNCFVVTCDVLTTICYFKVGLMLKYDQCFNLDLLLFYLAFLRLNCRREL